MSNQIEPTKRAASRSHWLGALVGLGVLAASSARAEHLTQDDIGSIISRVAQEATREGQPATAAIVDRDGNVLTVYRMFGSNYGVFGLPSARGVFVAPNDRGPNGGLNGLLILDTGAAISKAITGAYLSSSGNAFSTRTASQIVQDHFNPGQMSAPAGPLYGVQFSSLPCSDLNRRSALVDPAGFTLGPKRSPFGLSADPGGFPLYKNGQVVGGIGVIADKVYGDDENITNTDHDSDEIIALAGTIGYDAPTAIRADHITAGGLTLRYSDATPADFVANPAVANQFGAFVVGSLVDVNGYYAASSGYNVGTEHGTPASGLRPDTTNVYGTGSTAPLVMVNADNTVRYPAHAGRVTNGMTAAEVQAMLKEGYQLSLQMRAQIRQPLNSQVAVTVSVVDGNGEILGSITNQDAPVFGIDVSVQKARTALLMSGPYIKPALQGTASLQKYLAQSQSYFGSNIFNTSVAFSATATGNLSRDTYPDGIDGTANGPLGLPQNQTTPFNDGLQLDLITPDLVKHAIYISQGGTDVGAACTRGITSSGINSLSGNPILSDGMQIFPGGFPIYRKNGVVGAIGVSGDGVNQDDMVAFLGLYQGALDTNTGLSHAAKGIRASNLSAHGASPLYVSCPTTPLLNSSSSNLCAGK